MLEQLIFFINKKTEKAEWGKVGRGRSGSMKIKFIKIAFSAKFSTEAFYQAINKIKNLEKLKAETKESEHRKLYF